MRPPEEVWDFEAKSERIGTAQLIQDVIQGELKQSNARFTLHQSNSMSRTWRIEEARDIVISLPPEHARRLTDAVVGTVCSLIDDGRILHDKPAKDETLVSVARQFVLKAYGADLQLSTVDYASDAKAADFIFEDEEQMRYSVTFDRATGARHVKRGHAPKKAPRPCLPPLELRLTRGQVKRLASEIQESRRLMVLEDGGLLLVAGYIKHYEKRTVGTGAVLHAKAVRQEVYQAVRDLMSKA